MIIDTLSNLHKYAGINRNFPKAFEFVLSQDLAAIEPGKYPVDGTEVHASVSLKDGVKEADAKFGLPVILFEPVDERDVGLERDHCPLTSDAYIRSGPLGRL